MNKLVHLPFYARAALVLIGCYILFTILSVTQDLILPVIYATIIAILASPMVNFLVQKRVPRGLSIFLVSLLACIVLAGLLTLIGIQANTMSRSLPQLLAKLEFLLSQGITWVAGMIRIPPEELNVWLAQAQNELLQKASGSIGMTLTTVGGAIATVFLTPVYIVMILYYQPHLRDFVRQLFGAANGNEVNEVLSDTKSIIQSYLTGLFFEFLIVTTLNSTGLLIIGIDYAILLAAIAGVLNVIPYLGAMASAGMFMMVALVTKPPVYVVYVFILYLVVQFLDNNVIVPKVVGSKVKLNALISLFAVIVGASLWGIPGMLLSIPLVAVMKLVFDRLEPMKPWGFLMGDSIPSPSIRLKVPLLPRK